MIKNSYLIFCSFLIFACQAQTEKLAKYKTNTFTISYPPNFVLDSSKIDGTDFILFSGKSSEADNFVENINLITHSYKATLREYIDYSNTEVEKVGEIIESEVIQNNGLEIYRVIFKLKDNNAELTILQHSLIVNGKLFILTFSGKSKEFNRYQSEMEDIMLSLKIA